jgi:hypothetical protein
MRFIEIMHTAEQRAQAWEKALSFNDALLKNPNHAGGDSRARGMLAEIVFCAVYALAFSDKFFRQDFILGEHLINVKSNHRRTHPKLSYDVSVVCCDLPHINSGIDLVFVHLSFDTPTAYIVGWLPLSTFIKTSRLVKRGERLGRNKCFADTRVMTIAELESMDDLRTDGDLFAGEFCLPL